MSTAMEAAVLERMIRPTVANVPPDAARFILSLDFSDSDHVRIDELSAQARAGKLTEQERGELEGYIRLGDVLALLQSKARRSLKQSDPSAA
jgi:hypothetical protein